MNLKAFIKITWIKVILIIIIILFILYFPIIKVQPQCLLAPCHPIYYTISIFIHNISIGLFDYIGNLMWPLYQYKIGEALVIILIAIISYLISCILIYILNKLKSVKKVK